MQRSALAWAFRPFRFSAGHGGDLDQQIGDPRTKLVAGVLGMVLGVPVFVAGWLLGSVVLDWLIRVFMGSHYRGEVHVPKLVLVVVYGVAMWGGLMVLGGALRVLQVWFPKRASLIAMVLLPLLATGILIALMAAFMR